MERYSIDKEKLIIVDKEMQIDICSNFSIPTFLNKKKGKEVVKKDGKIKKKYFLKNDILHGEYREYENGVLIYIGYYFEGKLHGPSIFYFENKILSSSYFINGKKHGKTKKYYLSGNLYSIERYIEDNKEGKQQYFYEDGSKRSALFFESGVQKKAYLYFPSGSLKREIVEKENIDNIFDSLENL